MAKSPNRPKSTSVSANAATQASVPAVPQPEATVPDAKAPGLVAHVAPWVPIAGLLLTFLVVVGGAIAYYKAEVNALDRRVSDLQRDVATQGERDKASAEAQSAQIEALGKRIERL